MELPIDLLENILNRIHKEERLLVIRKLIFCSLFLFISLIGLIPSFKMLATDLEQSGFFNFFSLIFSDFTSILAYWQTFGLTLLETLPAISLAIFLAILATMLQSAKSLTHQVKAIIKTA